ncbi:type VII secretion system-associated protein [Streptomyces sp. cg35]|uniref:type VII secretion system-associated protein n=1 Tax=Streptomyces sp. cg35 TaxID=3421650 RepID=UPI003D168C9D
MMCDERSKSQVEMRPEERQPDLPHDPSALPHQDGSVEDPLSDIPDAVRTAALQAPGHWIGAVDPAWPGDRTPPDWAVVGEWRSEDGDVREYRANPHYRPSPAVLGWPEPTDPVDAAAQLAATGYGTDDDALAALAQADVTVLRGIDGEPLVAAGADGHPVVMVFSAPAHQLMASTLSHDTLPVSELADSLRGSEAFLAVNAGAAAPLLVPVESLRAAYPSRPGSEQASAPEHVPTRTTSSPTSVPHSDSPRPTPWPHTTGRTQ